ncbi:hypothetical protein Acsp03_62040 [Actinomadura sp. NBRC 104412]|uniref:GNAT family N-acetyltransferase n=1 Tax=Actinomadura sp. NBRC 104412 TaxID=3032203 RepID=UPI0024A099B5|nr:GNAT family N-acetyltransferase [Actinomadura sp. NBRC 104412]GLZ08738.1 hypothetical protein Acsp03_62040 [Actinomadura sp. NBRC 104412]
MPVELEVPHGGEAPQMLDELAGVYVPVYAEPPYNSAPKFSRRRFEDRTRSQMRAPGFRLVTARDGGRLVGFAFGFTMPAGSWWGNASAPPGEVLQERKFAVIELILDREHRGRGTGGALLDKLLEGRAERWATLAAVIGADAYAWYLRRGWRKVAEFRAEPPYSDALVLDLSNKHPAAGD